MNTYTIHQVDHGYFADFSDNSISQIWKSREGLNAWANTHVALIDGMQTERNRIEASALLPDGVQRWRQLVTRLELIETDDDRQTLPALVVAYWRVELGSTGIQQWPLMCFAGAQPQLLPAALSEWIGAQIKHQTRRNELLALSRASAPRGVGFGPTSSPSTQPLGVS